MKTEWLVTYADNMKDEFHFEVPLEWLRNLLINWATEDAKDVENDKESYIEGRADHLYESLSDYYFVENVFDIANKENVIINSKEVKVSE